MAQEDARQLFECRTPSLVHTHHLVVCRPPTTEILTENRLQRGCWVATAGDCTSIAHLLCQSPSAEVITLLYRMALGVYGQGEPRWWRNAPAIYRRPESCYSASGRSLSGPRSARPTQCAGECRICAGCKSSLRPSVTWSDLIGPCHVVFRFLVAWQRW